MKFPVVLLLSLLGISVYLIYDSDAYPNYRIEKDKTYCFGPESDHLGFKPTDLKMMSPNGFLLETYFDGIYKYHIHHDSIQNIDTFHLSDIHDSILINRLKTFYQEKNKEFNLKLVDSTDDLPYGKGIYRSNLNSVSDTIISFIVSVFFKEVEVGDSLKYKNKKVSKITWIRDIMYYIECDTNFNIRKVRYVNDIGFPDHLVSSLDNVLVVNDTFLLQFPAIKNKSYNANPPFIAKWDIGSEYLNYKGLQEILLDDFYVNALKDYNNPVLSLTVSFVKMDSNSFFVSDGVNIYNFLNDKVKLVYSVNPDKYIIKNIFKLSKNRLLLSVYGTSTMQDEFRIFDLSNKEEYLISSFRALDLTNIISYCNEKVYEIDFDSLGNLCLNSFALVKR